MSSKLRAAIDATKETLDLALLEVMHKELLEAVVRARDRGVKVRIVMDSMHVYPEKEGQHRSAEIQRLIDEGFDMLIVRGRDKFGLMHNKFALMDGALLWSGSANWSRAADNVHKENITFTADSHRIAGFQEVWGWMYGLGKPFGQPAGRADGKTPPQDKERRIQFHGEGLPSYAFGPGDEAEGWLLKAVSLARTSLDIAMFSCTSSRIKAALLEARDRGVKIRFVFDKSQFRYLPPMMWFVENGFDVKLGEGYRPGKSAMHHKFVILDGELLQNGSYNWTDGARYNNFENIQFFDDAAVVGMYRSAYERLRTDSAAISEEDLEANRAAAAQRAQEEAEWEKRRAAPQKPSGFRTDARRWMLSPFRRGILA
jgi:phosphatidylserine/phosphatidylglycerophosphate/cardiolipin synthase-like enzyme